MANNIIWEDFDELQETKDSSVTFQEDASPWPFDFHDSFEPTDNRIDYELRQKSEDAYRKITAKIVETSSEQLNAQNKSKNRLKSIFTWFFISFISVQYVVLIILLFQKALFSWINLSDTVLITYITSVFVETLGAIILMIKYAFDSGQEVNILSILNGVVSSYQKFEQDRNKDKNQEKDKDKDKDNDK